MKRAYITIIVCLVHILSFAQDVREQMNQIKMDVSFIKVEVNDTSQEAAIEHATSEMLEMINDELKDKKNINAITRDDLQPHLKSLEQWRGDRIRLLLYAKRAAVFGEEEPQEESSEENLSKAMQDAGIIQDEQSNDKNESTPEDAKKTENTAAESIPQEQEDKGYNDVSDISDDMQMVIESLLQMETAHDVLGALKQFKALNKIKDYGGVRTAKTNINGKFIIIFNERKTVVALLTPINNGKRINLLTQEEDDLKQYNKGQTAVLFE